MIIKELDEKIKEYYLKGLEDENFVMEAVEKTFGGICEKATKKEDMYDHVDFWWDSPKKGKIGIDVKGIKKNRQKDKNFNDNIHWIEMLNVKGKPGWIYGKSEYIAFRTFTDIIFVKNEKLIEYAERVTEGKEMLYGIRPNDFYIPYRRYERQDKVFKCPTSDLRELSDFIIKL